MTTCYLLQKTLLLCVPLLLMAVIGAARSSIRESTQLGDSRSNPADMLALHDNPGIYNDQGLNENQHVYKSRRNRGGYGSKGHHHRGNGGAGYLNSFGGSSSSADNQSDVDDDLALWINEEQVKLLSGFSIRVYAIAMGRVNFFVMDPHINQHIPTIPSEVNSVNFTWRSGKRKHYYHFDRLQSLNENVLKPPTISIKLDGRVPPEAREFSVALPCVANASGIATFSIGLLLETRNRKPVPGTPIRLSLKKECAPRAPDPECDKTCANHGWCNQDKICQCPEGYMGPHCQTGLCFPQCMHGGNCTAPGKCSCPPGYQGEHCEGGICTEKCLNGGKCNQKDKCHCPRGFYGNRCELTRCQIPCMNGGKCIGNNSCRCPPGFSGNHCEIGNQRVGIVGLACKKPCRHGTCNASGSCVCDVGWFGRVCNQREWGERRPRSKRAGHKLRSDRARRDRG